MSAVSTIPTRADSYAPGRMKLTRSFVTVVFSTMVLLVACLVFAPSSVSWGALSGSLPFAAIIAIVGLGQLMVDSVAARDMPVVQAVALIFAAAYVLLNLTADVLATLSNPRLVHRR